MTLRQRALALTSVIVVSSMVGLPGRAGAQVAPTSQPEPEEQAQRLPTVVLLYEPDRPDSNRLISAIESHLVGLPVQVALEPLPRSEILTWLESGHLRARARQALGLLAIDTSQGNVWRLFFLDADGAPTLIRRLRSSSEHAPLDEAGIAVRLLIEALLDSKQIPAADALPGGGVPPKAAAAAARAPSSRQIGAAKERGSRSLKESSRQPATPEGAPSPSRGQHPLALFLGPVGSTWLAEQPWHFGATGGVELALAPAWSLSLAYTWYPTLTYHLTDTDFTLTRHPATSYLAYTPGLGFSPRIWLGLGVDAVLRDTVATAATYRSSAPQTTWSWGPIGGLGLVTPLVSAFRARFDFGIQIPAKRTQYVTESGSRVLLASTRAVSPFLSIYLSLRL